MRKHFVITTFVFFLIHLFFANVYAESPVRKSVETRKVDLDHDRENNMRNTEMKQHQKSKSLQKAKNEEKQNSSHSDESKHRQELEQSYKKQWEEVEKGNGDPRLVIGR